MTIFAELVERAQMHDTFWEEDIVGDFTEELVRWMEAQDISKSNLAALIGHRPSYITKVLRGSANLTAASMAKLARAVGARVLIHLAPPQCRTIWRDVYDFHATADGMASASSLANEGPMTPSSDQQRLGLPPRPNLRTSDMRPIRSPFQPRNFQRERMSGVTR
jgi:transcriptional regulator with XRE-family HTH domain